MSSLKEQAKEFVADDLKNIADLSSVDINIDMTENTYKEGTPDEYKQHVILVDKVEYRVPIKVIKGVKAILEVKPDTKKFKVIKSGAGLQTDYQVVPL